MATYAEYAPHPALARRLVCVWESEPDAGPLRIVPDGCVDLIWYSGQQTFRVAGPDTVAAVSAVGPGERFVGLRFGPGAAADVLGVPAHAIRDERVALGQLWGEHVAEALRERFEAGGSGVRVLEGLLADRVAAAGPADPLVAAVLAHAGEHRSVTGLADRLGVSERQLRRRSHHAFGYGPKALQRVLRFHRALTLARRAPDLDWAGLAYRCGYADQAHLARDVRGLAGATLTELTSPTVRRRAA